LELSVAYGTPENTFTIKASSLDTDTHMTKALQANGVGWILYETAEDKTLAIKDRQRATVKGKTIVQ
jgi:hypothetical protein